jgi:hypothetical protein
MRRASYLLILLALATSALAQQPGAPFTGENLLVSQPAGYKVDYTVKSEKGTISEMVPQAESVNNWTEMVTVQIFFNQKTAPRDFKTRMEKVWSQACADATSLPVVEATENGYPVVVWQMTCPLNKQTGKPEWTYFKAIGGNDSFYVVQKAFKFEPSKEQVVQWTKYLKSVSLCDTRVKERECKAK